MVEITFEEAKEFLENINGNDKVAVIHHDDLDGFSSGIIFYDWCKTRGAEVKNFIFKLGTTKLNELDLTEFNKVIMTDLAPNSFCGEFDLLKTKQVFYTDHHPKDVEVPEFIFEFRTTKEGYIPSSRSAAELTGIKKWLGIIGTVSDAGDLYEENEEFIEEFLNERKINLEELKNNGSILLMNVLTYFGEDKKKFFEILEAIENYDEILKLKNYSDLIEIEIKKWVDKFEEEKETLGDCIFYCFDSKYPIRKQVSAIIGRKYPEETLVFANPEGDIVNISARNSSRKKDMAKLLKISTKDFEGAMAGGHIPAAGATILKKDIGKFKENLKVVRV